MEAGQNRLKEGEELLVTALREKESRPSARKPARPEDRTRAPPGETDKNYQRREVARRSRKQTVLNRLQAASFYAREVVIWRDLRVAAEVSSADDQQGSGLRRLPRPPLYDGRAGARGDVGQLMYVSAMPATPVPDSSRDFRFRHCVSDFIATRSEAAEVNSVVRSGAISRVLGSHHSIASPPGRRTSVGHQSA